MTVRQSPQSYSIDGKVFCQGMRSNERSEFHRVVTEGYTILRVSEYLYVMLCKYKKVFMLCGVSYVLFVS